MAKKTEYMHQLGNKVYNSSTRWIKKGWYETNYFEAAKNLKFGVWMFRTLSQTPPTFGKIDNTLLDNLYARGILDLKDNYEPLS